ncbi:MAG: permease [Anaerolineales bacterium]
MTWLTPVVLSGWTSLLDYLAAHVLLCLVPAFVIAGYMSAVIPKEAVTRYLGPSAKKRVSYPAAAIGGFVLAVCSCTILPLFAGIWKRGAGLGPAITFLFVGPAVNILAIAYTGAAIGFDFAIARIVLSIIFGVGIGMLMALIFRRQEAERAAEFGAGDIFASSASTKPAVWWVFGLLFAMLIAGTLQVDLLTKVWWNLHLPVSLPATLMASLDRAGLNLQGALLISLLLLLAPIAFRGLNQVLLQVNRWTYASVALTGFTILSAAPTLTSGSLNIGLTGKFFAELILMATIGVVARRSFEADVVAAWLWETWRFVKQIFPLLIVGVFAAGMVKEILPAHWVQTLAGRNTIWANFLGVSFGVFMYFPTLVEVPIARMFLDLGMHRGPLLAYLLADPELSLQSILVTGRIMGRKQTVAYVGSVSIFSTLAGYLFGLFLAVA